MKYKVGDVVKVRSDLNFSFEMIKYKGKISHIKEVANNWYHIFEDNRRFFWTDEMFEPLTEEDIKEHFEEYIKGFKDYDIKVEVKKKEPVLDEEEKKYLSAVIRPFRSRINYILKYNCEGNKSYISICTKSIDKINYENIDLPYFEKNKMYKGMEKEKHYTLEELGI